MDDRSYALIFENVLPTHRRALEVIRMIVSVGAIPQVSKNDPKILDFVKLRNFVVVVTTDSLTGFSNRFLSYFVPMRIAHYQKSTWNYIFEKVAESYGIHPGLAVRMFAFLFALPDRDFCVTQPLQVIGNLPDRTCESDEQSLRCLRSLLLELHFLYTHRISPEDKKKFVALVGQQFSEAISFIDDFNFSNEVRLSGDMQRLSVGLTERTDARDRDEAEKYLKEYNEQSAEKITLRLYDPIMRQYRMLLRAITTPGGSVLIQGVSGIGKESMCRLAALRYEYDYTRLSPTKWQQQFGDALMSCINHGRQGIVFVRQSEFNKTDLDYLINFVQTVAIGEILTGPQLTDLYDRVCQRDQPETKRNLTALARVSDIIRHRVHLVFDVNNQFGTRHRQFIRVLQFNVGEKEDLEQIAMEGLETLPHVPRGMPQFLAKVFIEARDVCPRISLNMFYDLIGRFAQLSQRYLADAISRGTKTKAALQFLEEMKITRDELQVSLAELEPQLQSLAVRANETSAAVSDQREKVEKRRLDLEDQDHLKKAEVTRLGDELGRMRQDFHDLELLVPSRRLAMCKLTDNDLSTMRLHADSPSQRYTAFFEFLSALLGGPPQRVPNGKMLACDPSLVTTLSSGINPPTVSVETLAKARHIVTQNTFTLDSMEAIAPALGTIFDWAMAVYNYCQMREKIRSREAELKAKEDDYNRFVESTKPNREKITELTAQLDSQVYALSASAQEKELLEKKFSLLNSEFRMVGSILKGSDSLEEQWQKSLTQFDTEKQLIMTFAAVTATYLVCCGMMNCDQRIGFMQTVGYDVTASGLTATDEDLFVFVGAKLALLCDVPIPSGLGEELERDLRHIYCAQRPPLVMDNDGLLISILSKDATTFSML
jgi:uncharacterized membrane protein YciS (DUF1049 family)